MNYFPLLRPAFPLFLAFSAGALASDELSCQQWWAKVAPTAPVPPDAAAVFDPVSSQTIAFGGTSGSGAVAGTWGWDGTTWTQLALTGPSPGPRGGAAMVFDSVRSRSLLFGGGYLIIGDAELWEWNGASWSQQNVPGPPARMDHAMVYDAQRDRVVLFGGQHWYTQYSDTWEFDGTSWTQHQVTGPSPRRRHAMAYDIVRGRTVLYGGTAQITTPFGQTVVSYADTWEWDGVTWVQMANGPAERDSHKMTYDLQANRVVLFGGKDAAFSTFNETWEWDGVSWQSVTGPGPTPEPTPEPRHSHVMAYDSNRLRNVVAGGIPALAGTLSGTWERGYVGQFDAFGAGCDGSLLPEMQCSSLNPAGGTLTGATTTSEVAILATGLGNEVVTGFEVFTQSTGGTQVVPAHLYAPFSTTPLASTTLTVGPTPGFYRATLSTPMAVGNSAFLAIDISSQNVVVPDLINGSVGVVATRTGGGTWSLLMSLPRPGWKLLCRPPARPTIGHTGTPVVGGTYDVTLTDVIPSSAALLVTGFSNSAYLGAPLPATLPTTNGCDLLVSPEFLTFAMASTTGDATSPVSVPAGGAALGVRLFHQWAVLDPVNPLGLIVSNGGEVRVGQ